MTTLLLALFAACVALLTLFSGFGLGTLLMPAFALFLPVDAAVAATAVVHAANNLFKAGLLAGEVDRGVVLRFGLPAVAASFVGAFALTSLAGQASLHDWDFLGRSAHVTPAKLVMGLLILAFALFELVPRLRGLRAPARWLPIGGMLSGFFGGLSGHQGALRAIFLAPLEMTPARFAGTQAIIALCVDGARLIVYGAAFRLASEDGAALPWPLIATVTCAAFAGSFIGKKLLTKITLTGLHRVIGALLLVVGVALALGIA
jgi:uncharacterized membrane protein YfcA